MPRSILPAGHPSLARLKVALIGAGLLLFGACSTAPEYKYVTKVSGGERIEFPITGGGPAHTSQAGLTVLTAQFIGPPHGGVAYLGFVIKNESGQAFKHVRVDDISDETPVKILEDTEPKMVDGSWRGLSDAIKSASAPVEWLAYLDASNRVYRLTVTLADGKTVTLNQLSIFPAWLKDGMRRAFKAAEEKKEEAKPQS